MPSYLVNSHFSFRRKKRAQKKANTLLKRANAKFGSGGVLKLFGSTFFSKKVEKVFRGVCLNS